MASAMFEVVRDCSFAGIPLQKGMLMVVRPGHPTRPITVQLELPPNYGMILNLLADESVIERDAFEQLRAETTAAPTPDRLVPPAHPRRPTTHLRLVR